MLLLSSLALNAPCISRCRDRLPLENWPREVGDLAERQSGWIERRERCRCVGAVHVAEFLGIV